MFTPSEIQETSFEKAMFGGYDMASVNSFVDRVGEDYATLYKENATLKGKLKVLVETVEEYRSVDEAMRKALLSAQKMARDLIDDAKRKSEGMLSEAATSARAHIEELNQEIRKEKQRLEHAKHETVTFVTNLRELYRSQIDMLAAIPEMPAREDKKQVREDTVTNAAKQNEDSIRARLESDVVPAATAPEEEVSSSPTPVNDENAAGIQSAEIVFGNKDDMSDLWKPEEDTEVPPLRIDMESLQSQFGAEARQK